MFTSTQNPTILECLLANGRKAKGIYQVLKALGLKIILVRSREGFDVVPLDWQGDN